MIIGRRPWLGLKWGQGCRLVATSQRRSKLITCASFRFLVVLFPIPFSFSFSFLFRSVIAHCHCIGNVQYLTPIAPWSALAGLKVIFTFSTAALKELIRWPDWPIVMTPAHTGLLCKFQPVVFSWFFQLWPFFFCVWFTLIFWRFPRITTILQIE